MTKPGQFPVRGVLTIALGSAGGSCMSTGLADGSSPWWFVAGVLLVGAAGFVLPAYWQPGERTVTTTLEVHQHPGESPELFARRIADELVRGPSARGNW